MKPKITLYLDKRRKKKSGLYPVKIRVWDQVSSDAKFYPTGVDLSENDFQLAWETRKPKREFQPLRDQLEEIRLRAVDASGKSNGRVFSELDKKLYRSKGDGQNILYHYDETIKKLMTQERIGTASSYRLARKSLSGFLKHGRRSAEKLMFVHVDSEWLENYELYMTHLGRSRTTVGIYLRTLRAIFNTAIELSDIEKDIYPFGRRKYVIPAGRKVKKALSEEQLKVLFYSKPANQHQERAKDFFFFSYNCNGMNMKDIASLRFSDLNDDTLVFYRAKTIRTTKDQLIPVLVYLNDFSRGIISKYGNTPTDGPYVFSVLNEVDDATERQRKTQAFTRSTSQHLKKLAIANNLPEDISTIWARHSFATLAVRSGKTKAFVKESFGHKDEKTTEHYFAGFEDAVRKEFAQRMMDF